MRNGFRLVLLGIALAVGTTPVLAQGKGKGAKSAGTAVQAQVSISFEEGEVRIIREYYREPSARPKPLPPGIAKNLARGKPLPPGIAKRSLPTDLSRRLTVRDGVERVLAGDKVVLVRAGIVIDILAIFN